jgi:hypothetical protein
VIVRLDLWDRFLSVAYWWMHAMVTIWLLFTLMLFVAEPLLPHQWLLARAKTRPEGTFGLVECCQLRLSGKSWNKLHRVVAKVEWHPGELYPRGDFFVTSLGRPAERDVAFYNQRGTAEQWIKEGQRRSNGPGCYADPLPPTPPVSSSTYSPTISATPCGRWDCPRRRSRGLIKIGTKVTSHARYVTFQLAEVAVSRQMFQEILMLIVRLRAPPTPA